MLSQSQGLRHAAETEICQQVGRASSEPPFALRGLAGGSAFSSLPPSLWLRCFFGGMPSIPATAARPTPSLWIHPATGSASATPVHRTGPTAASPQRCGTEPRARVGAASSGTRSNQPAWRLIRFLPPARAARQRLSAACLRPAGLWSASGRAARPAVRDSRRRRDRIPRSSPEMSAHCKQRRRPVTALRPPASILLPE